MDLQKTPSCLTRAGLTTPSFPAMMPKIVSMIQKGSWYEWPFNKDQFISKVKEVLILPHFMELLQP